MIVSETRPTRSRRLARTVAEIIFCFVLAAVLLRACKSAVAIVREWAGLSLDEQIQSAREQVDEHSLREDRERAASCIGAGCPPTAGVAR